VLNLSTNVMIGTMYGETPLTSDLSVVISKQANGGTTYSGGDTQTVTETVILGYDDTGLSTADGTHTRFQVNLLLVRRSILNHATGHLTDVITMEGSGYGTIQDKPVILKGTVNAKVSGVMPPS